MRKILLLSAILISFIGNSQKKTLETKFTTAKITIDGKLSEEIWKDAPIAKDFVTLEPDNGKPIAENRRTEVKVLYDNDGIYIGAIMYDDQPNKIMKEISQRDDFGSSDLFGVFVNGFNDGQQDFRFLVSASDGQGDSQASDNNGEDNSWDAVWSSKAVITNYGWVVEMKIPYSALRFSPGDKQTWGLNFFRLIQRDRQKYTWNFVDNKIGKFITQAGTLEGIKNIKTPTRLFLLPYASYYANADAQNKTKGTLKGGLDIKYGINDAFTLDAVLIPDFGQTKYDDKILNLGPFEQQFNENRPFFTEGTDLFSKGDLVYSRRIGGSPSYELANDETYVENVSSNVSLINALKVSGRTKKGLGIGVLNAVTETTVASVLNTSTNETRRQIIEPLSNYNVLVFDQRFNQNSSVSFVNTNVTRNGSFRDANVSGLVWDLNTKKNTYQAQGNFEYSHVSDFVKKDGIKTGLELNETSGKYRFGIGGDLITKNFDINDLGILNETNFYDFYGNANYRILSPTKHLNSFRTNLNLYTEFEKQTGKLKSDNINININADTKKNHSFGMGFNINPLETFDFYESRTEGRYFIFPTRIGGWAYFSSNYNNKFAFDINPSFAKLGESGRNSYGISGGPRYRFNDKFSMSYGFNFFRQNNNKGFVDSVDSDSNTLTPNDIIFANRTVVTYSNNLNGKYSINSRMNLNFSARQYWSFAENKNFLSLEQDGHLKDYAGYTTNKNSSFNSWNFDLSYSYWFAPGSQVSVLYRNNAGSFDRSINKDLGKNITNLLNNDSLSHVFSVSVKYFIDYNQAKHWF